MPEPRTYDYPEGFTPPRRGPVAPVAATPRGDGPDGTRRLPVVRDGAPKRTRKPADDRDFTGEPRPFLPRAFWPKMLGLFVLVVVGVSFLAINGFDFSAFMAMLVIGLVLGVIGGIGYLIAKANKKDEDHSNPQQGPDKVEDHRDGHHG